MQLERPYLVRHGDANGSTAEVDVEARIFLRPVGSSLPLGFLSLAVASVILSGQQLGWLPTGQSRQIALVILLFPVPLQLVASVFGFLSRDSVGGTGMGLLASSWLADGVIGLTSRPGATSRTLGLLLFVVSATLLVPVVAAALGKVLAAAVLLMAAVRFALTGIYQFHGGVAWSDVSGWMGVAVSVVALYAALAFELEDTQHRTVLPVFRWRLGRRAITAGIAGAVDRVGREAGVREEL